MGEVEPNELVLEDVMEKNIELIEQLKKYNKSFVWLRYFTVLMLVLACIMTLRVMGLI